MTETNEERLREIIERVSGAAIELVIMRHCLEVDGGEPSQEEIDSWKEDIVACLTGDDPGCNDPDELNATNCELIWLREFLNAGDSNKQATYELPDDALRHLPSLIEAAKGIVNAHTWGGSKGYQRALKEGVAELQAALKPFLRTAES
jgi:hypothetical protein